MAKDERNPLIELIFFFNGKKLILPVNPAEMTISQGGDNEDINVIGKGKTMRKNQANLRTITIESFLPSRFSYFFKGTNPWNYITFFEDIMKAEISENNAPRFVTHGTTRHIDMRFLIDNFDYTYKAGEEMDVYYSLSIKEFIPYGVKKVEVDMTGMSSTRAQPAQVVQPAPAPTTYTYTIERNDCLWNIAVACTGNGADWPTLYEYNRNVIGSDPGLIFAGTVLTLPPGWQVQGMVPKLVDSYSSSSSSSYEEPAYTGGGGDTGGTGASRTFTNNASIFVNKNAYNPPRTQFVNKNEYRG